MSMLSPFIHAIADGKALSREAAGEAFSIIMNGDAQDAEIAAFIMGLKMRGETVDELVAGAQALRAKANLITAPDDAVDTCGTGGDGHNTYNISTAAAIVAAAAGVPIAKHGNKAVSSKSGSADVLSELGVRQDGTAAVAENSLNTLGICFLLAPLYHPAMRHVAHVRKLLGLRTIFNLLGPLSNPAGTKRQLIGVYDKSWLIPMATALRDLGSSHLWVVHGADGLDELTITGKSHVVAIEDGALSEFMIRPEDAGLQRHKLAEIQGGDAAHNAAALRDVLSGKPGAYRDIVVLNAAAAILIGGKAQTLKDAAAQAVHAIDSGKAAHLLENWANMRPNEVSGDRCTDENLQSKA